MHLMRILLPVFFLIATVFTIAIPNEAYANIAVDVENESLIDQHHEDGNDSHSLNGTGDEGDHHSEMPAGWTIIPFALLLIMIATGPLFYEHFWHKSYPVIAVLLASIIVLYYIFGLHNHHGPVHALAEYVQFIALLAGLYIASGGIMIEVDKDAKPLTNVSILLIGAVIANIIGTTGASMLLIRPFIRLNKNRIKPYHIIFFIFIVSNIGGSLTPIGDPPLFLGFLKGIPFFWTITNNFLPWVTGVLLLTGVFFVFDKNNKADWSFGEKIPDPTDNITLTGSRNFFWLALVVGAVFLDPNVFNWVPSIQYDGQKISFLREIIMLACAYLSFRLADKKALTGNDFSFEPIREVAFIFVGIFGTMMPALEIVGEYAKSPEGAKLISHNTLYWGTGALSGFLDNAPTYINFLTAAMASAGTEISNSAEVVNYSEGAYPGSILNLKAISVAAVFFGAMTYIGNGPNFMVKSIAEQVGIKMPSFFGYVIRFSIPILVPMLVIIWLIFFAFA